MAPVNSSSHYGVYRLGVAAYILREIWVARGRATFEGMSMRAREICLKVIYRVQILTLVNAPKKASTVQQSLVLSTLGISIHPVRKKKGRWCKWDKTIAGLVQTQCRWFRTWRSYYRRRGNLRPCGQDNSRFLEILRHGSTNFAEFLALRDGLQLCKGSQLSRFLLRATLL